MIMRFAWLSWKPPDISPEAELKLAQTLAAHGQGRFISSFLGLSDSRFSEVHGTGLVYLGGTVVFAFFAPVVAALFGIGFVIYYLSLPVALSRYVAWLTRIERKYRLPPTAAPPGPSASPDDNPFYEAVAREIDQQRIDKVLWTRAVANSAGDDKLAKSLYIRYRAQALLSAHTQQAREQHEARVLERERQTQQERQAQEAAARKQVEERQQGCLIVFAVIIGIVILFVVIGSIGGTSQSQPASSTDVAPANPRSAIAKRRVATRAALEKRFADLQTEYDALAARRAALDSSKFDELGAFNRDAADYTRRVTEARAEKARLDQ